MARKTELSRFVSAQDKDYQTALSEIKNGRKRSHWMWYIFPQITGLGYSEISKYYAIKSIDEASDYFEHPILGRRLVEICEVLLQLKDSNANQIFGSPDDLKLKSSMTLFSSLSQADPVFELVLDKYFKGEKDKLTLEIISKKS